MAEGDTDYFLGQITGQLETLNENIVKAASGIKRELADIREEIAMISKKED